MIYLLQDCYKDEDNIYHDILKIGYSKDKFDSSRRSMYNTHNFGYKFLGEKEGSQWLETFLHRKFSKYRLSSGEWFEYSEEIMKGFWEISEEDVSDFSNQEELNEFIRGYILDNLVPSVNKLISLYLEKILGELKEKDPEYDKNKNEYKKEILITFDLVSSKEREYFEKLDFTSQENIKILEDYNLIVGKSKKKDNYLLNDIVLFYKIKRKGEKELSEEDFKKLQDQRRESTKNLLDLYNSANGDQKSDYLQKLKRDSELYVHDFVGISNNTNLPVYNYLIEISNERAWEVSQKDYQDKISVTKSLYEAGYISSEYESEEDKIVSDFIDHIDTDPQNNQLNNLRKVNQKGNMNNPETLKKLSKPVLKYSLDGEFLEEYPTLTSACKSLGLNRDNNCIQLCCEGKLSKSHGYKWKYKYPKN